MPNVNQIALLSPSLGHHVRTFAFDFPSHLGDFEQAHFTSCAALILLNLPNIRYLIIGYRPCTKVTDSAIVDAIAKLQHLERVAFKGKRFRYLDESYSPRSPIFDTHFNAILSSHAEQLTSLSLQSCPFHLAPGRFELLRESLKNLRALFLDASLARVLLPIFAQPVTWACADRLVSLDLSEIHDAFLPILVEHIANGRFGNLKRLRIGMDRSDREPHIVIPTIQWSISPLDVLILSNVAKLELEILGCLHAKEVHVEDSPCQATIEAVQGGGFEEMAGLRIRQRDWEPMWLDELASACANRNAELLFITREEIFPPWMYWPSII